MPSIAGSSGKKQLGKLAAQERARRASLGLPDYVAEEQRLKEKRRREYNARYNAERPTLHRAYRSKAWVQLRRSYRAAHPLCEECLKHGVMRPMAVVDHITELKDGGALLDVNNLQSLCMACHNRKTEAQRKLRRARG